ncbi:hypothetical protein [Hymenobacter sublimis]|uniref:Uncharacterized protein n=1 Tax=Hymenobacter sublimis TaxID=2933777 RepID=A0ABY4JBT8_9BACT|nr:hypothetical protein [Hymenobacter sublimis]UPL50288.1 hypothetical protein MWH26_05115 [Hymenobacter sublimis]
MRKIEELFAYDSLVHLASEVKKQELEYRGTSLPGIQENIPFGLHVLQLAEQGHPCFFGLNADNEPQVITLPLNQASRFTSIGYYVGSEGGTFRLHRTTFALWVAGLSFSQLKQYYPRIFEGNNSSTMVLTPPDEFGVLLPPDNRWGQLYASQRLYDQELREVAAASGVVITHNEQENLFGLYHRGSLVEQGAQLEVAHLVKLITHRLNTPVAYHQVKQKVLDERYDSAFPKELDNFDNWDGEILEHRQFPLANLFYVRVQAATENAALHIAREEIIFQRRLNPVRIAARGLPFEIESVVMLDRVSNAGFYEVRYHFVTQHELELASAS